MIKIKSPKSYFNLLFFYLILFVILAFVLTPFLWALVTSLKTNNDVLSSTVHYLPNPMTFQNYIDMWTINKFSVYFTNSLFVSSVSVIGITILSILAGYALSRYEFGGKRPFMVLLLCIKMIPAIIYIIPLFIIFKNLGLINTPFSLIIYYTVVQLPFNTLLMIGFISNVPKQIDEAAMVDGATRMQIIFKIILPVILPGVVATASFAFISCWNEFIAGFTFISSSKLFTMPVGLRYMIGEYDVKFASLAAGSIIALLPSLLLFSYVQKYLVHGMGGSVKG